MIHFLCRYLMTFTSFREKLLLLKCRESGARRFTLFKPHFLIYIPHQNQEVVPMKRFNSIYQKSRLFNFNFPLYFTYKTTQLFVVWEAILPASFRRLSKLLTILRIALASTSLVCRSPAEMADRFLYSDKSSKMFDSRTDDRRVDLLNI